MIYTLAPIAVVGTTPGVVDWSTQLGSLGADFVRLANWTPNALTVSIAGRDYTLDPWSADLLPGFCKPSLRFQPVTVSAAAPLPAATTAALLVTVAFGEVIPGVYPLPLSVAGLTIDPTGADIQQLNPSAAGAVAGAIGLAADAGHRHPGTLTFDNTVAQAGVIYGASLKTGLASNNSQAPIYLEASQSAFKDDSLHDFNVGLFIANWTKNGAGVSLDNEGQGDGIFIVTKGTVAGGNALNLWSGDSTHQLAVGTCLNVQRFGVGKAVQLVGQAGSGTADLLSIQQSVNGRSIGIQNDDGSTTADTITVTCTAKTSGNIVNLFHTGSTFTGYGLLMNFGSGAGAFTGAFIRLLLNGVLKFQVDSAGHVTAVGGVGNETVGHNHSHNHGAHSHGHAHSVAGTTNTGGADNHTHTINGGGGAGVTVANDATGTTPTTDASGESALHTHTG